MQTTIGPPVYPFPGLTFCSPGTMRETAPGPVVIAATTGREAVLIGEVLGRAEIVTQICHSLDDLCQAIRPETGAVLMSEGVLEDPGIEAVLARLQAQEPWSDLPVVLLTVANENRERGPEARLAPLTFVTILERPFRTATLISMVEAALRARQRQLQMRDLIQQRDGAIADMQRAEETVRRQSALLRAVTEHAPDPIFAKDLECRLILANPATLAAIGKPQEAVLGLSELEWWPENPEAAERILENDRRVLATGKAEQVEEKFGPPGAERTFLSTKAPMRDASGEIVGLVGVSRDITERKNSEQELADAHRFLHSAIDALSGHIAVLDEHGVILAVNEAWRQFADENRFDGRNYGVGTNYLQECQPNPNEPSSGHALVDGLKEVLESRREEFEIVYPCHSPTEQRWFLMHVTAFRTTGPRRVVVAHEDITERKRAEEALRGSESRLTMAVAAGNIGTWVWNIPDNVFVADERLAQFFDVDPEAARTGLPAEIFIARMHPDDRERVEKLLRQAIDSGDELEAEYRVIGRDWKIRWVYGRGRVERDEHGKALRLPGALTDITAHKRSEEALRESEERFRTLADDSPLFIWMADPDANATYANRTFLGYLGLQHVEAFSGRVWERMVHPQDLARVLDVYGRAVREQMPCVFEVRLLEAASNEMRWHLIRGVPRFVSGQFAGFMGMGVDIHDRKRAEEAVRRSADQQRILSEALAHLLSTDDPETIVDELFPKLAAHLSVDAYFNYLVTDQGDEMYLQSYGGVTEDIADQIHRLEFGHDVCGRVAVEKEAVIVTEIQNSTDEKSAHVRSLGMQCYACSPLMIGQRFIGTLSFSSQTRTRFDEAEREFLRLISNYVAVAMERARAQRALRLSEAQLRAIYDGTHEYIGLLAPDGTVLEANRASLAFGGTKREEVVGLPFWEAVWFKYTPGAPALMQKAIARAATGESIFHELSIVHPTGEEMTFDLLLHPIRNEEGEVVLIVPEGRDMTERKRAEEALRDAKVQAEAANTAKDHFLAMLSHELRTPLTPVLMCLSDRVSDPALPEDLRADLAMICRNVQLEARLIDDLLDLTRIARSKLELHTEVVDAHEVLREALEVCSANDAVRQRLTISLETFAEQHHVNADRARLQQVFWNLINNAFKFTPDEGKVLIRTSNPAPGQLEVEVSDTGIGIEPEKIPQLFDAFEQGERTITRRFGGLGLGLAISKALVELHGGKIRAHSEGRGFGSKFFTELEVCAPPPVPSADICAREVEPAGVLEILLVEDHAPTLNIISRLLRRAGHTVSTASRVEEARALLAQQTFDLLVSDLGLPDGTGIDLVRELNGRNVPSIALSGYGMDADIRECLAAGFHSHLTKPIDWRQLETAIHQITSAANRAGRELAEAK